MTKTNVTNSDYYSLVRSDVASLVPGGARKILECGCGEGYTGAAIKKHTGAEITGIEIHAPSAKEAEKRLDKVINADLDSLQPEFPENYFDLILFPDVLEHTKDPWAVLKKLKPFLKNSGQVIASIPNIRYLPALMKIISGKLEYEESGVLDISHLHFFTLHTIKKMFEDCGFKITDIQDKKGENIAFKTMNFLSLSLLKHYSIYQYIITAKTTDKSR